MCKKENLRKVVYGKKLFIVDYRTFGQGSIACAMNGTVVEIDEAQSLFDVRLENNMIRHYKVEHIGDLVFESMLEAMEVASKIPVPGQIVKYRYRNKIKRKAVQTITGRYIKNKYTLMIQLVNGERIPVKDLPPD